MAATGVRYYTPNAFEIDANGVPLAGAQLFFYITQTSTPLNTYQDVALTTANPNPVIADANGRFGNIFLVPSTAYKVQLWTAPTVDNPTGSQIWSMDPCGPAAGGGQANTAGIIGEVRMFAGPEASVPATWYPCYGQAFSRTTFASLFAVIGTLWGPGDGSTTFNLPDLRGRGLFGNDVMGGTPANRITSGGSGIPGSTNGASGGSQFTQTHTHTVNDPTHTHGITDPGHLHNVSNAISNAGGGGPIDVFGVGITGATQINTTGITINAGATGITLANYGTGSSGNMPPAAICEMIIYAGA